MISKARAIAAATAAVAAAALLSAGCIPGGDDEDAPAYATTAPETGSGDLVSELQSERAVSVGEWRCGDVKEALYGAIATLAAFADANAPADGELTDADMDPPSGDGQTWTDDTLTAALEAAARGLTAADQAALNGACELYGQHDAALELWAVGERGDACDVWLPAHATAADSRHDLTALHPIPARMWASATGAVAEGHGRCIAERAN